jgi:cytochrome c oxidase subunit II
MRFAAAAMAMLPRAAAAFSPTSIFSTQSTPARQVNELSFFVLGITAAIFLAVSVLLAYALVKFRARSTDTAEPPQVFGSTQIELSWTIIPILIVTVLFLGTARVLFSVQDAPKPASALDVTAVGHQFWWEFRYPQYNVTAANELHIPVGQGATGRTTFLKLTSADVIHSFWIPQLGGKTDMLPNRVNEMWLDPKTPGVYLGQCAQFCGAQHAKMLLTVYVDTPEQFASWIAAQQKPVAELANGGAAAADATAGNPAPNPASDAIDAVTGQKVFEQQACINCHTVSGTVANGHFGPDLTHLMSRGTLASGAMANTPENLKAWIASPDQFKPGCLMPAMHLTDRENAQITAYLLTLK